MTAPSRESLRIRIKDLLRTWRQKGIPPRWTLQETGRELLEWRKSEDIKGLWESPPLMVTATLDDGWGHGIELIECYAEAVGLRVLSLGILQPPEVIVKQCNEQMPDLLGLTVLQFDSEPDLRFISENLPSRTRLIVGGAPFRIDPEFASRTGVHYVAKNVADFLEFVLDL